jgi:hypothetical protein
MLLIDHAAYRSGCSSIRLLIDCHYERSQLAFANQLCCSLSPPVNNVFDQLGLGCTRMIDSD